MLRRINQDNYIKETNTIQDSINEDKDQVIKALDNFVRIPYDYCEHLVLGARIKYITN